jgi:hypothetical protein
MRGIYWAPVYIVAYIDLRGRYYVDELAKYQFEVEPLYGKRVHVVIIAEERYRAM